jgi:drug/metabolite transporter (DMT)-like permease
VATFAFAAFMLKERFGFYRAMISTFMVTGTMMIVRPEFIFPSDKYHIDNSTNNNSTNNTDYNDDTKDTPIIGYIAAISVPILSGIVSILTRQLKKVDLSVQLFWFGVGAFPVAFGGLL